MLDYIALGILIFTAISLLFGAIAILDIPYKIAVNRNHPHQDAIYYAGWVSLFTLHAIWPFLWIWAMMYHEDRGWGMETSKTGGAADDGLAERFEALEARLANLESAEGE